MVEHTNPAEQSDLEPLCRLYIEFHEFHVRGVPDRLVSLGDPADFDCTALVTKLATLLATLEAAIFVAVDDGRLVGLAEIYLRTEEAQEPRAAYRYGYLQSLLVRDVHRCQGIGQRLLYAVEAWAVAHGAVEVRLENMGISGWPASVLRTLRLPHPAPHPGSSTAIISGQFIGK